VVLLLISAGPCRSMELLMSTTSSILVCSSHVRRVNVQVLVTPVALQWNAGQNNICLSERGRLAVAAASWSGSDNG
jgi:hypothetical protein